MRSSRCLLLSAVVGSVLAGSVVAQIPTKRPSTTAVAANAPRLLVANPHAFTPQDSGAAVQAGEGMRARMEKVVGSAYFVIPRTQMNDALQQFGYPPDAILALPVQRNLATSLQARSLISSQLSRGEGGKYSLTARFAGITDDAGTSVSVAQNQGQDFAAFGAVVADQFQNAIKAYPDAKACMDQQAKAPDKAAAAARKALSTSPKNGLAHYCLATLALAKHAKGDSAEALKHLQEATQGDPLSLPAWTQLAALYEAVGDTNKTVNALLQMLLVAPTNQPLREQVFKLLIKYQRPDAAQQTIKEGLRLDPTNADLWDLLSNACVYKEDYGCAVDALENVIANDSTKADSTFYLKIITMASQKPDTARLLKWAQRAVQKYPKHEELNRQLLTAYSLSGNADSMAALTRRLMQLKPGDTTLVVPSLAVAQQLISQKRLQDAMPFLEYPQKYGNAQAKENVAGLLLNAALPLLQEPQDLVTASDLLKRVIAAADPAGKYAPIAQFYLGVATLLQVPKIDPEAEKQKSCDLAKQEQTLLDQAETAFKAAAAAGYQPADVEKNMKYVNGYRPRVASMLKVYCK